MDQNQRAPYGLYGKFRPALEWSLFSKAQGDDVRRGRLLAVILLGSLFAALIVTGLNIENYWGAPSQKSFLYLLSDAFMAAALVGVYWLNRSGRVKVASYVFLFLWTVTITVVFPLRVLDRVVVIYAISVAAAGFLIKPVYSFGFALLAAAGYTIAYFAGKPAFSFNHFSLAALLIFAIVFALAAEQMERALHTSRLALEAKQDAQRLLSASEERYQRLHESMMDCFVQVDMAGHIVDANTSYLAMLGYPAEEIYQLRYQDITPQRWATFEEEILGKQILPRGYSDVYEKEYIRKDETAFPIELRTFLLRDASGQPSGMWAIVRDISARKQAEDALRQSEAALAQAQRVAHVGSWKWYIQDNRLEWSDEMYRIFGLEKERFSGSLSAVIEQAIHPEDRARVNESNRLVAETGNPVPLEYRVIWPDGRIRVVWAEAGELVYNPDSQPYLLSGIAQDITERKQAEQTLKEYSSRLEADVAERTRELQNAQEHLIRQEKLAVLGQLAGGVGHELRNPLAVINNAVYYLKLVQPNAGEKIKEYLVLQRKVDERQAG